MRIGGGSGFWGRDGKADVGVLARVREETRAAFTTQMSAYHSTSELWDDGVLDPAHTRDALAVALNTPFDDRGYGVFRM